jgi:hypothetical protein
METVKDLAKHYLMIVLGILTALGLEAWVEHIHHRHAAEAASTQIEAEIRENKLAIEQARDKDQARMQALDKIRQGLISDIKSNATNAIVIQHIRAVSPSGLYLDWRWPQLRHEAWDVAVANQSAGWIDSQKLHRYTTIYSAQNFHNAGATVTMQTFMDGPRMIDAMIDLETGEVQPRQLLYVVNQMQAIIGDTISSLNGLDKEIDEALSGRSVASH